jgi:signal peptidase I
MTSRLLALTCLLVVTCSAEVRTITVLDTGSMKPVLRGGERLEVVHVPWASLRVGMVVVFQPTWRDGWVVHRIVGHEGKRWITKGDNVLWRDPGYLIEDRYVGCVEVDRRSQLTERPDAGFAKADRRSQSKAYANQNRE